MSIPERIGMNKRNNMTYLNKSYHGLEKVNIDAAEQGGLVGNNRDINIQKREASTNKNCKKQNENLISKRKQKTKRLISNNLDLQKDIAKSQKFKEKRRLKNNANGRKSIMLKFITIFLRKTKFAIKNLFGIKILFKNKTIKILSNNQKVICRFTLADFFYSLSTIILSYLIGFLFGTAKLFEVLTPFSITICIISMFLKDKRMKIPSVLGTLVGSFISSGYVHTIAVLCAILIFSIIFKKFKSKFKTQLYLHMEAWMLGIFTAVCTFPPAIITTAILGKGEDFIVLGLIETLISSVICIILFPLVMIIEEKKSISRNADVTDMIAILVTACVLCSGLQFFNIKGFVFGTIFAYFITGYIGYVAGTAAGTISGASTGLILSMTGSSQALIGAYLCITGLFCGIFGKLNKIYACLSVFILGTIASLDIFDASTTYIGFGQALMASLLFLITPRLKKINMASKTLTDAIVLSNHNNTANSVFVNRIEAIRSLFEELDKGMNITDIDRCNGIFYNWLKSETFSKYENDDILTQEDLNTTYNYICDEENSKQTGKLNSNYGHMASLVSDVCDNVCVYCAKYNACWKGNFFRTYRDISLAITLCEINLKLSPKDLSESFRGRCVKIDRISDAVNSLKNFNIERNFSKEVKNKVILGPNDNETISTSKLKEMLSMELNGLIAIFDLLKSDLKKDTTEDDKLKKGILKKFSRIGFEIEDLFIKSNSIGKVIEVIKPACRKERECINVVLPIISNQTRTEYMLYSIDCANDLNKMEKESVCYNEQVKCLDCDCRMCKIKMIPTVKYCVEIDVVEKAKCEGQINGDSYMVKLLDDGRLAIAISDGMGTGVSASKESKAAIRMLSRLLEIGVTSEFAVQTVNLMMFARSRQDSFTTLDLSVIDLLTGNVQIIKAGAPPSIVKKRKTVRIVGEHSLPAGVFIPIEIQKEELILSENDIMIMMSDGVKEGDFSEVDWNKKANKVLVHVGDACVSEINRALLNLNKFSYKRQEKRTDDLTILTVRLKLVNKENATMFPVIFVRDNMYIRNMVETTPRFAG